MSRFNKPISQISKDKKLVQVEIFPQRVLNIETAQTLLNELNEISGITRMVVFGPRLPKDNPDDLLEGKFNVTDKKYLNIKGEMVELTVQVGRLWIEVNDMAAIEKIKKAGEKTLPFPFEMYEGNYIRTQKTTTDYARKGGKVDNISLGLMDPKAKTGPSCCGQKQHVE